MTRLWHRQSPAARPLNEASFTLPVKVEQRAVVGRRDERGRIASHLVRLYGRDAAAILKEAGQNAELGEPLFDDLACTQPTLSRFAIPRLPGRTIPPGTRLTDGDQLLKGGWIWGASKWLHWGVS